MPQVEFEDVLKEIIRLLNIEFDDSVENLTKPVSPGVAEIQVRKNLEQERILFKRIRRIVTRTALGMMESDPTRYVEVGPAIIIRNGKRRGVAIRLDRYIAGTAAYNYNSSLKISVCII